MLSYQLDAIDNHLDYLVSKNMPLKDLIVGIYVDLSKFALIHIDF